MDVSKYDKKYLKNLSLISILSSHKSTYNLFSLILSLWDIIFKAILGPNGDYSPNYSQSKGVFYAELSPTKINSFLIYVAK